MFSLIYQLYYTEWPSSSFNCFSPKKAFIFTFDVASVTPPSPAAVGSPFSIVSIFVQDTLSIMPTQVVFREEKKELNNTFDNNDSAFDSADAL